MSAFVLKLIAVVSMLIDHAAYSLFLAGVFTGKGYVYMRAVGRIAFPIFAYMIVNGFEKTHDVRRYFSRLALFAVISQPVYRLAFSAANYGAQALTGGGITLSLTAANITTPCLAALIAALDALRRARGGKGELFRALMLLAALAAALLLQKTADYGWMGLALIAALYLARSRRVYQAGVIVLWCVCEYAVMQSSWFFALYAMLAAVPVLLYSGRLGARMRGFYLVYPVHLGIFYVLSFLVSR